MRNTSAVRAAAGAVLACAGTGVVLWGAANYLKKRDATLAAQAVAKAAAGAAAKPKKKKKKGGLRGLIRGVKKGLGVAKMVGVPLPI